jgi:ribosomal protein S18 acetylase RimI-like enzyme
VTVREARSDEGGEIRALLTAAYGQYAAAVAVAELFRRYLEGVTDVDGAADRSVTLVAESGDRVAGTARYYPPGRVHEVPGLPADWAWVRAVGVHPDTRRAGVARELMADCLRRATADGAAVLSLHTISFMPDAIRLYERLGYRRVPELDLDIAAYYGVGGEMVALAYRLDVTS